MSAKTREIRSRGPVICNSGAHRESARGRAVNGGAQALKLKHILVPIDFSEGATKALRYAVPLAEEFGATVHLVYVLEQNLFSHPGNLPVPQERLEETARIKLLKLAQEEIEEMVPVHAEVRIGHPGEEITAAARERKIDLIIIATRGYTGLKHVLLGSTAERVVRQAPCPVLAVREEEQEFV